MTRQTAVILTVVRCLVPLLVFGVFAAWMVMDWRRDPYDPALTGTRAYGHNGEGSLEYGIGFGMAELVVFYLVTWPFLIRRPRWFFVLPLLALLGLAVWAFLNMVLLMHSGGVMAIHFLWLIVLVGMLLTETILSAVTGFVAHARARAQE
jgi:hypothetical protein